MTTKFIGLKELRQNLVGVSREAIKRKQQVIVLKKNIPIFELRPLTDKDISLLTFDRELAAVRISVRKNKTYSTKEVRDILSLKAI